MRQAPFKSFNAVRMDLTTSSSRITLSARPTYTSPRQVRIVNPSTTETAFFRVGDSTINAVAVATTATANMFIVPPSTTLTYTLRPGTHIAGIATGNVNVYIMVGEGED